jgi:uncharacterized membrane protein YgcG
VRAKALGLFAAVALAALLPLYGDPTPDASVSHPEWARLVLRGLSILSDEPGVNETAAQAFATLSGRDSRSFRADRYVRGTRVEPQPDDSIRAVGGIGEAVYAVGVARPGDYRLRLQLAGGAPAEAEIKRAGDEALLRSFPVPAAEQKSWVDAGVVHLDPGAYNAAVLLPEGATLDFIELAPPCLSAIEPRGGWKAGGVSTTEDVAVTVLQALDLESELPPSGSAVELSGGALRTETGEADAEAVRFSGGPRGTRAVLEVILPEDGLYTLSVFGEHRGGMRWLADGCRKSLLCPAPAGAPGWRVVLSGRFQRGPHVFDTVIGPDSVVDRIRIEPKKDSPADYVATAARLGLELGPEGPVTRERADEARRFIERLRLEHEQELCGDILEPGTLVAELSTGGPGTGGGAGGGGEGGGTGGGGGSGGGGGNVVPPPVIPPLPPASPTLPVTFGGGSAR